LIVEDAAGKGSLSDLSLLPARVGGLWFLYHEGKDSRSMKLLFFIWCCMLILCRATPCAEIQG
jgi:hypothetical protein